jgi:hypothetical protein
MPNYHTERFGDQKVWRRSSRVGSPEEEWNPRSTSAVGDTDGTCKLNTMGHKSQFTDEKTRDPPPYKSPGLIPEAAMRGFCASTISSIPLFAWNGVSMSEKMTIEPSAPPPLQMLSINN